MANKSDANNDRIIGPELSSPSSQWTIALFYNPTHAAANTSPQTEVISWQDNAATARIFLQWDSPSGATGAWYVLQDGTYTSATYPRAFAGGTWCHLVGRWGNDYNGEPRQFIDAIQNGVQVATTASAPPNSASNAKIALWSDVYGQPSAMGQAARLGVWNGIALTDAECTYLANGGSPLSVRPSNPSALVQYLDLTQDVLDTAPTSHPQTVAGTSFAANPSGLLSESQHMGRANNIFMTVHRGGYTPTDAHNYVMYLLECTDGTGINFEFRPCYQVNAQDHIYRDGDTIYDPVTSKWYSGCINEGSNGVSSSWDLFESYNGVDFYFIQSVDCSSITGTGSGKRCWKPRWFIDPATNSIQVALGLASTGQPYLYLQAPIHRGDLSGAWNIPTIVRGTGLPETIYDGQIFKVGSTYFVIYVNWAGFPSNSPLYVELMASSSLNSDYIVLKSGDWAGFGSASQGPCIIQRADGRWVIYHDTAGNGTSYSISSTSGDFSAVLASATWSTLQPITIHGSGNVEPNFVAEGPTVHIVAGALRYPSSPTLAINPKRRLKPSAISGYAGKDFPDLATDADDVFGIDLSPALDTGDTLVGETLRVLFYPTAGAVTDTSAVLDGPAGLVGNVAAQAIRRPEAGRYLIGFTCDTAFGRTVALYSFFNATAYPDDAA